MYKLLNTYYSSYLKPETVYCNGYPVNKSVEWSGRMTFFSADTDPEILRNFIYQNGYLWLKQFYNPSYIYSLEQKSRIALNLNKSSPLRLLTYRSKFNKDLMRMARSQFYLRFSESIQIKEFIHKVFELEPRIYKRKIIRIKLPNFPISTGAHYDFNSFRKTQGLVYTIWIPIGDIPANAGAITYLNDSKGIAKNIEEDIAMEAINNSAGTKISNNCSHFDSNGWIAKRPVPLAKTYGKKWLLADFEAGDIVIHDHHLIHAAAQNTHQDKIARISTDIRFQSSSSKLDERWQDFWHINDGL